MNLFASDVFAQTASAAPTSSILMQVAPFLLVFVIFYFLLIRPQQKKQKMHQAMIDGLKKGDRVVTTAGIYGTIQKIHEQSVILEIGEKIKIEQERSLIARVIDVDKNKNDKKESNNTDKKSDSDQN